MGRTIAATVLKITIVAVLYGGVSYLLDDEKRVTDAIFMGLLWACLLKLVVGYMSRQLQKKQRARQTPAGE